MDIKREYQFLLEKGNQGPEMSGGLPRSQIRTEWSSKTQRRRGSAKRGVPTMLRDNERSGEARQKGNSSFLCLSTWKASFIYCSNLKTYLLCKSHFIWIPLHIHVIRKHYHNGIKTFCLGSNTEHAIDRLILSMIWFSCDKNPGYD